MSEQELDGRPAVFLDRDGTLTEEVGYLNHESRLRLIPGAAEAVRRVNDAGLLAVLVTNQAGVARGWFAEPLIARVHDLLRTLLHREAGARLDAIFYCPHHPESGEPPYRQDCDCRKPRPGMLHRARRELGIDLARSYLVSDQYKDVAMGVREGLTSVLVLTGYGRGQHEYQSQGWEEIPHHVAADVVEAIDWILARAGAERPARREA